MDFPIICLVFYVLICPACSYEDTTVTSDFYEVYQCSSSNIFIILTALFVEEMHVASLVQCAISCRRSNQCNFAVFHQSTNWCKHVYGYGEHVPSLFPHYTEELECFVLRKKNKPLCQNKGFFPGKFICHCPPEFRGWECEEINPDFCRNSQWREMGSDEYLMYRNSSLQMKLIRKEHLVTSVIHVPFFAVNSMTNIYGFQVHNLLSFKDAFHTPLVRLFHLHSDKTKNTSRMEIGLTGSVETCTDQNDDFKLYIRRNLDKSRLFYSEKETGTVTQLIDGLSSGYRLLTREFTRVGFDKADGEVYFENVRTFVDSSMKFFKLPLSYVSVKHTLKYKKKHSLKTEIQHGEKRTSYTNDDNGNWELDRCWKKYDSNFEYIEMAGILRETVLTGLEIRLVINSSISTDVVMVTMTNNDVVVAIADYLTPFNGVDPLNSNSRIRLSLISHSKTLGECEMQFEGKTVYSVSKYQNDVSLDWIVSSRYWIKAFVVASNGSVVYGSRSELYKAAVNGQNIRVCVERTLVESVCYGNLYMKTINETDILFQTPAVLQTHLDVDGVFSGHLDPDCRRYVWLLSTIGTIQKTSYVIGVETDAGDIVSESFLTMSWFWQY